MTIKVDMDMLEGAPSTISDGDKGDITISDSASVFTIDNGVVTLAKMANIASGYLIGRGTAATGVPEAVLPSADFTMSAGAIKLSATERVTALTCGATTTIDLILGNLFTLTLTQNTTIAFSNPPAAGRAQVIIVEVKQDGTGSRTMAQPASVKVSPSAYVPTTTATTGRDLLCYVTMDQGTSYDLTYKKTFM